MPDQDVDAWAGAGNVDGRGGKAAGVDRGERAASGSAESRLLQQVLVEGHDPLGIELILPFAFALRAELEARAGGNPSWNTGVNYIQDFARSADAREVRALYRAAGLSLRSDLRTLNNTARISADPAAVRYLERNIIFNGRLSMPVLTMHTTGDGLVVPENEQAYRQVVRQAGDSQLLRQIFVARAGHCAFTPAETITAAQDLLHRLDTGRWGGGATNPNKLNASAAALGSTYNVFASGGQVVATPPAFVRFQPPRYLRPFDTTTRQQGRRHRGGRHLGGRHHGRRTN